MCIIPALKQRLASTEDAVKNIKEEHASKQQPTTHYRNPVMLIVAQYINIDMFTFLIIHFITLYIFDRCSLLEKKD